MYDNNAHLDSIEDIKKLMNMSSRFVSLSGWSGIAAGVVALASAVYTANRVECWKRGDCQFNQAVTDDGSDLRMMLLLIGLVTFFLAFTLAFFFTYARSRKNNIPVWSHTSKKVLVHVCVPMIVGGLLIWRMMDYGMIGLVAPACLLFYGIGLVSGSKFTLPEIRYLGYSQIILGIINLWMIGYGLYFWAAGFGVLHILYGAIMWRKYERNN